MKKHDKPTLKGVDLHIRGENRTVAENLMFEIRRMAREGKDIPGDKALALLDYLEYKYTNAYPLHDVQRIGEEATNIILEKVLKGCERQRVYNAALSTAAYYNLILETQNVKKGDKYSCIQYIYEGWVKNSKSVLDISQYRDFVIVGIIAYGFMGEEIMKGFSVATNREIYNAVKHPIEKLKPTT